MKTLKTNINKIYTIDQVDFVVDWENTENNVYICEINSKNYYLYLTYCTSYDCYICTGIHEYFGDHKEITLNDFRKLLYNINI